MALIHLIYVSSACGMKSDAELELILESAVRHNAAQNITGMLLYANGSFMQVLEGDALAVDETYARVVSDSRHGNIFLLERDEIPARSFSQWHMGFRSLSTSYLNAHPAYADFFSRDFAAEKLGVQHELALQMLYTFAKNQDINGVFQPD
ncbi:MAG: BLUF domain-containing protein [Nitrosomonadales bacterium]